MKIFVNASNLTAGGGLSVGVGFIRSLTNHKQHRFVVLVPRKIYKKYQLTSGNVQIVELPKYYNSFFGKISINNYLKNLIKNHQIERIISLSNYAIPTHLKQVLFLHWPYAVYPEDKIWERMSFKSKIIRKIRLWRVKRSLKYASVIVVQTEVMKRRLEKYIKPNAAIKVIPSSVGFTEPEEIFKSHVIENQRHNKNKIFLCLNEYYEHKNLEILIKLARMIKRRKLDIQFLITLKNNSKGQKFMALVHKKNIEKYIINLGYVERSKTKSLMQQVDALIFPSLIESFGIPLVEAMSVGLPIFTSDRDFSHVVCADYAIYFKPLMPSDILKKIRKEIPSREPVKPKSWDEITSKFLAELN